MGKSAIVEESKRVLTWSSLPILSTQKNPGGQLEEGHGVTTTMQLNNCTCLSVFLSILLAKTESLPILSLFDPFHVMFCLGDLACDRWWQPACDYLTADDNWQLACDSLQPACNSLRQLAFNCWWQLASDLRWQLAYDIWWHFSAFCNSSWQLACAS